MGYYTQYTLKVTPFDENLIPTLRSVNKEANFAIDDNGETAEECKWYDHKNDLKRFSKNYPMTLFELSGIGEENGDMWKMYVKGGKSVTLTAVLTYPEFNEKLLEP